MSAMCTDPPAPQMGVFNRFAEASIDHEFSPTRRAAMIMEPAHLLSCIVLPLVHHILASVLGRPVSESIAMAERASQWMCQGSRHTSSLMKQPVPMEKRREQKGWPLAPWMAQSSSLMRECLSNKQRCGYAVRSFRPHQWRLFRSRDW
jgi:hypothetical protein